MQYLAGKHFLGMVPPSLDKDRILIPLYFLLTMPKGRIALYQQLATFLSLVKTILLKRNEMKTPFGQTIA